MNMASTPFGILRCHARVGVFMEAPFDDEDLESRISLVTSHWTASTTVHEFVFGREGTFFVSVPSMSSRIGLDETSARILDHTFTAATHNIGSYPTSRDGSVHDED